VKGSVVSVVMTNYNDGRFLRESVPALLSQSYPHLQIVIVDDGSTDDSVAFLNEQAGRDSRLRVLENGKNLGIMASVTRAEAAIRGDYVYFASADDQVLPGFFAKCAAMLDAHPEAGFCWTDPCQFFESGGPYYGRGTALTAEPAYISAEQLANLYRSGRLSAPMHAAPALLRRKAYEAAGGLIQELRWYCDFFMTLVIAFRTGMCYIPEALTSTRVQQRSFSRNGPSRKEVQREVLTRMLDLLVGPAYRDILPFVRESGVLAYFGTPIYRIASQRPEYQQAISPEFRGRARKFSFKHAVRRMMHPRLQRLFFSLRSSLKGSGGKAPSIAPDA